MLGDYYSKQMSGYGDTEVQRKLTDQRHAFIDSVKAIKDKVLSVLAGTLLVILLPYLHLGVFYLMIWVPDKPEIDRKSCSCSCFDTVFRGRYENPGQPPYKHIYFNTTSTTMKVWVLTVVFMLMGYESVKFLVALLRRGVIRHSMVALYAVNVYPQYYSWWMFVNYYNEEFFSYYYHQMYFTITEIIATCVVLNLCDSRKEIKSWKILLIVTINMIHILLAGLDQFLVHVFLGQGKTFLVVRDVGLMVPDLLHVIIPIYTLYRHAKRKHLTFVQVCAGKEIGMFLLFVTLGVVIGRAI